MNWLLGYTDSTVVARQDSNVQEQQQTETPSSCMPSTRAVVVATKASRRSTALELNTALDISTITPRIVAMGLPWRRRTEKVGWVCMAFIAVTMMISSEYKTEPSVYHAPCLQ